MSNRVKDLIHFYKKHRRTRSLIMAILVIGYFVFKRFFYNFFEQHLENDIVFYILVMIAVLDLVFDIIVRYYEKKKTS
ncbi:hypothetical protein SAMN02745784_03220 [Tissierella praeacuta DSM 18095]|uniref:Uncharacterized protein n=1 Tax=Tissierella praeacuta DSM 18095 TaxID=1123404 RepID=A0A1M4ZWA6_9FIRM|nr:hypothetical protein [Tissierella praeacuta]SHF22281.1 hypothetical protein SAMN02745784_03220 [Tissierella praeacuta DSM 18095]SUQ35607.1 Uncharacterised protein [Tissierella praeacuta]